MVVDPAAEGAPRRGDRARGAAQHRAPAVASGSQLSCPAGVSRHPAGSTFGAMKVIINGPADLQARAGQKLATGPWHTMDMARIRMFADATGDHQWIHVD